MKLHASYSLIRTWNNGLGYENAVKSYFKLDHFTTKAQDEGKRMHQIWADHVKENGTIPTVFGTRKLNNPLVEQLVEVEINEWLSFKMYADLIDEPVLIDWKTGAKTSEQYASEMQLPLYGAILSLKGIMVNKGEIYRWDWKNVDHSYVWLTKELKQEAMNLAVEQATQIHNYFLQNGLYEKYQANRDQSAPRT